MDARGRHASRRRSPTPPSSATRRPIRPPTSRATTPRRRPRSSRASPSTRPCRSRRCTARASPASPASRSSPRAKAGYVVKLLAICERLVDAGPASRRRRAPACTRRSCRASHPLAAVHGANNAVFVEAEAAGNLMFYGAGAGGVETASAVLGDLVSAARRHVIGGPGVAESTHADLPVLPMLGVTTRYQITLARARRAGRARRGSRRCSASTASRSRRSSRVPTPVGGTVRRGSRPTATLVIGTHEATEAALAATVAALAAQPRRRARSTACSESKECREAKMAHQWRGVLREYADRLDVSDATPDHHARRGRHAAHPGAPRSRRAPARRSASSSRA